MAKNSKIRIQAMGSVDDDLGQPVPAWADVATVWADIRDIGGREFVAAGGERSDVTTRIRIWRRPSVTAAMRVLHGATVYTIKACIEEGRDTTLLMCVRSTT